jgi:hypothetical protein
MSKAESRIKKRKAAKETFSKIIDQKSTCLVIHYSCESFYNIPIGRTPRITSIAVEYFDSGQTKSFSIHKIAELQNISLADIIKDYDRLERLMLDEFYQFVDSHKRYFWLHLNMRDINYGFEAIAHRYSVLGGTSVPIDDSFKIDIGRLLVNLYGPNYINHPRMENLYKRNGITMIHFLTGEQEASAFDHQEYVKLHQSTLRKVENLQSVINRANEGDLKTDSNLIKQYGLGPQSLFQMMQENWIVALIASVLGSVIAIVASKMLK